MKNNSLFFLLTGFFFASYSQCSNHLTGNSTSQLPQYEPIAKDEEDEELSFGELTPLKNIVKSPSRTHSAAAVLENLTQQTYSPQAENDFEKIVQNYEYFHKLLDEFKSLYKTLSEDVNFNFNTVETIEDIFKKDFLPIIEESEDSNTLAKAISTLKIARDKRDTTYKKDLDHFFDKNATIHPKEYADFLTNPDDSKILENLHRLFIQRPRSLASKKSPSRPSSAPTTSSSPSPSLKSALRNATSSPEKSVSFADNNTLTTEKMFYTDLLELLSMHEEEKIKKHPSYRELTKLWLTDPEKLAKVKIWEKNRTMSDLQRPIPTYEKQEHGITRSHATDPNPSSSSRLSNLHLLIHENKLNERQAELEARERALEELENQ